MLEARHLRFQYPGSEETTLFGLNFDVAQGEIFGFLGPSGSGKSTTQKILYKLLRGYKGEARFKGKDLDKWDESFYRHIGVSFELPNHYGKLSALENLEFFASFYPGKTRDPLELLASVGLENDAGKRVSEYSKGMKMRLNFVRALLHDPEFLFLDEPTSGLDPNYARMIKRIILDLKRKGTSIFLTTHNMTDADELCDRVALLHRGNIITTDRPASLKLRHGKREVCVENEEGIIRRFPLDGLGENTGFTEFLNSGQVRTIHSEEASLEDVFIQLTGEKLV